MADGLPKKEEQKNLPKAEEKPELAHEQMKELGSGQKKELAHEEKKQLSEAISAERRESAGTKADQKAKELESDLVRLQAEFENYKKRSVKEMAERAELGKMEMAKSVLPTIDEYEHALSHLQGESKAGMAMVFANLKKALEKEGVREMECAGQYDPYRHEVILMQESEKPEGTIIAVARKGYVFRDRVLRHAQVVVAKKKVDGNDAETDAKKGA